MLLEPHRTLVFALPVPDVSGARVRFVWRILETLPKLTPSNGIPPFVLTKSKRIRNIKTFFFRMTSKNKFPLLHKITTVLVCVQSGATATAFWRVTLKSLKKTEKMDKLCQVISSVSFV